MDIKYFLFKYFLFLKNSSRLYFSRTKSRNTFRTNGPAKKICQQSATGKLSNVVWSHTAITSDPGCLNNKVAMKLMIGHIRHTIIEHIASVIKIGLSSGDTIRKASFFDKRSTTNNSRTNATGHIIGISWNANKKISFDIPPLSRAML